MVVGLDIGYGHVKTVTMHRIDAFPSVLAPWPGEGFRVESGAGPNGPGGLRHRGARYLIGDPALRLASRRWVTLDRDWAVSDGYQALLLNALARVGVPSGAEVRLVTGLPVGDLERQAGPARQRLLGTHQIELLPTGARWDVTVSEVAIMPQPFGTLLGLVLDHDGGLQDPTLAERRVGILDIGFLTTNYLVADRLEVVVAQSFSRNSGMAHLLRDLGRAIQTEYGIERDPHDLDEAALRGRLTVSGHAIDLAPLLAPLLTDHAEAILAPASMLWGPVQALDAVLVTGGGGPVLAPQLEGLGPHVRLVPNARLANATGYYRYGRRVFSRTRQAP